MGRIIRFPIIVIDDKANEEQDGITPILESEVRTIAGGASTESVVSESGIQSSLSDVTLEISGANFSDYGLPVFVSVSGDNIINMNSLSGVGVLNITSDSTQLYINTSQPGNPGSGGCLIKEIHHCYPSQSGNLSYGAF